MAFKMKGSPMKRNFGIGASPVKQGKDTTGKKPRLSDAERGYTNAQIDAYRRKKIADGWKGDELKAIMDAWKKRMKPTQVFKVKKEDLLEGGGLIAE